MTAVILAAGSGNRFKGLTIPKALIKLSGVSLLERTISLLQVVGVTRIVVVAGYKSELFSQLLPPHIVKQFTLIVNNLTGSGSVKSLLHGMAFARDDVLILEGDLLFDPRCLKNILLSQFPNQLLTSSTREGLTDTFVYSDLNGNVFSISKGKKYAECISEYVGIAKLSKQGVDYLLSTEPTVDFSEEYDSGLLSRNAKALKLSISHIPDLVWCDIDSEDELIYATQNILPYLPCL